MSFLVPFQSSSRALGSPFNELHREMNRLLDDFLGAGSGTGQGASQSALLTVPRMDVREAEKEILVCCELPGVQPSDVDLRMEGNLLTIRGEKKNESEQKNEDYHVMERSFGRFQRSIQLPFAPNPDEVKADFDSGVLTIHIPKQPEQERSRRIQIEAGEREGKQQPQITGQQGGASAEKKETTHH